MFNNNIILQLILNQFFKQISNDFSFFFEEIIHRTFVILSFSQFTSSFHKLKKEYKKNYIKKPRLNDTSINNDSFIFQE